MELVAHESVLALAAGIVLIWVHEIGGTVSYERMRGFRHHLSERGYQVMILGIGIVFLTSGLASLLLLIYSATAVGPS